MTHLATAEFLLNSVPAAFHCCALQQSSPPTAAVLFQNGGSGGWGGWGGEEGGFK